MTLLPDQRAVGYLELDFWHSVRLAYQPPLSPIGGENILVLREDPIEWPGILNRRYSALILGRGARLSIEWLPSITLTCCNMY